MSFARNLERMLESVVDRVAGRVFPGSLQPAELAGRVVRAVDLAVRTDDLGPSAPNVVEIRVHPADLGDSLPTSVLENALAGALDDEAATRGWRLGGPTDVRIHRDEDAPRGDPRVRTGRRAGPRPAWGRADIVGGTEIGLTDNRLLVGRAADADVVIANDSVSRRHALLWREAGEIRVRDLGSANGTFVGGRRVAGTGTVADGAALRLGEVDVRVTHT